MIVQKSKKKLRVVVENTDCLKYDIDKLIEIMQLSNPSFIYDRKLKIMEMNLISNKRHIKGGLASNLDILKLCLKCVSIGENYEEKD